MLDTAQANNELYDVIGIGLGPFNLGLAALLDTVDDVNAIFFEQKPSFDWHSGMLIEGTTLQVPFMADLVTLADPTSKYSFLNYLQEHHRMYHFYFLERFHIPRREYNHYCQWVSSQLDSCRFSRRVINVSYVHGEQPYYEVEVINQTNNQIETYYSKHLVLGVGSQPIIPEKLRGLPEDKVFHSAQFLQKKQQVLQADSITVIGSGQSAAEVFYDLLQEQTDYNYTLEWFTRSKGFFPMEYSKLGLEHFSPDYINYFYQLPQEKKDTIIQNQDLLYKGISAETIEDIYKLLYDRTVATNEAPVHLQAMTEVEQIELKEERCQLNCYQWEKEAHFVHNSDIVILGTGYKTVIPDCLSGLFHLMEWDEKGRYKVERNYRLKTDVSQLNSIFIQNGELHTHGVGAPDLGLGAYRNAVIINTLVGEKIYPEGDRTVFQTFGNKQSRRMTTV